jgi:hypothetical protein
LPSTFRLDTVWFTEINLFANFILDTTRRMLEVFAIPIPDHEIFVRDDRDVRAGE